MPVSIKQYKLFTLVSMYSFNCKYAEINVFHLHNLLQKVQTQNHVKLDVLDIERVGETRYNQATWFFSQVFDFEKLRLDLNYNDKETFTNDFTEEMEGFRLWGVDPGQVNIFSASDGHGNEITAKYYTRAGFKKINQVLRTLSTSGQGYNNLQDS